MRKRHPQRAYQLDMYHGFYGIHNMYLITGIVNCYIYERWKKSPPYSQYSSLLYLKVAGANCSRLLTDNVL